ncbi:MAG: imidazolonepropionase [Deltaproteobacteria bacterium]|nr:imidazolonepropionase [Deltaproteobacteria bacterium]
MAIVNARVYPMTVDAQPVAADTIVCDGGRIVFVGPRVAASLDGAQIVDARGGAVVPGLIDAHTHFVFAGDRVGEFRQKSEGATYEAIAKQGGGIWKTVLATRKASEEELVALAVPRLEAMRARGVTTVECKGGYGLDLANERKMLRAAREAGRRAGLHVVTTFLALHTFPKDAAGSRADYVHESLHWLEALHGEGLVDGADVFVETSAFLADDARATAKVAKRLGLPLRLHVDQLSAGRGAALCAELAALSADHLEHMAAGDAELLAKHDVVAGLVPWASLYVGRGAKPPIAALRAAGVKMMVATDFNPGSAPVCDLLAAAALSVGYLGLTVDEALLGITRHAAQALGLGDRGVIKEGAVADLVVLDHPDAARAIYELGRSPIRALLHSGNPTAVS